MNAYTLASIILSLAILISYLNHRTLKMQSTIAIMVGSMLISLLLIALEHLGFSNLSIQAQSLVLQTDFKQLLLNGMLGFLLFAGALAVDFKELKANSWEIGILAILSTLCSTLIIATAIFYLLPMVGLYLPYIFCLLFGSLISPTDPIAVLNTFKKLGAPKSISACVEGEALFNDGVGIVLFVTLMEVAFDHSAITWQHTSFLFLKQAVGGVAYGAVLGFITHILIKYTQDSKAAILITLMTATGGYTLALNLDISGALAMVVAGIVVGNQVRSTQFKHRVQEDLEIFWEVIDEVLNAVLFLLIGLELLVIEATPLEIFATLLVVPLVLVVRFCVVATPMKFLQRRRSYHRYLVPLLTWGGLRGGLAVALALSLPPSKYRELVLVMTYAVVAFSVIVQGTTIKFLAVRASNHQSPH